MATSKSKGGADIRFDEFVKQVKPDPASTDQVVLMTGYVGASDKDDHIRLYSDSSLNEYLDIPRADILFSTTISTTEDPLGGSKLWVKQNAQISHSNPQAFAQGNIYSDYMQNAYTPANGPANGPVTLPPGCPVLLTKPVICHLPSKFICPTPVSKQVICTIKQTVLCPVTTHTTITTQPSLADGCPSALGCTITIGQTQTVGHNAALGGPYTGGRTITATIFGGCTIITGTFRGTANDFTGGDIYGDYMQNAYQPTAAPATELISTPQLCVHPTIFCPSVGKICPHPTLHAGCPSYHAICGFSVFIRCPQITLGTPFCPITTPTTTTITPTTPQHTGPATQQQAAADFSGGDIYGDYMQNAYQPAAAPATALVSTPQICVHPTINTCLSRFIICHSVPAFKCLTQFNQASICHVCWPTTTHTITITPTTPQHTGPATQQQAAADFTGGDLYGDYMQNAYQPAATAPNTALASTPQVCAHITINTTCLSRFVICHSVPAFKCFTQFGQASVCHVCWPTTTHTVTFTTTPQHTGPGGIPNAINPYGY